MVLDAHAEGVDQDGDHDSSAKILAVYNLAEGVTDKPPEGQHRIGFHILSSAPTTPAVGFPHVSTLGILGELIHCFAVRVRSLCASEL